jgi:hypothetical protein
MVLRKLRPEMSQRTGKPGHTWQAATPGPPTPGEQTLVASLSPAHSSYVAASGRND